jgi:hypothetical protein
VESTEIENKFSDLEKLLDTKLSLIDEFLPADILASTSSDLYLTDHKYLGNWKEIIEISNDFLLVILKEINLEIINGAYIKPNFETKIKLIEAVIIKLETIFTLYFASFIKDEYLQTFKKEFINTKSAVNNLNNLCSNLFYNDNEITYSLSTSLSETFENLIADNKWSLNSIKIFAYNVYLINADHYLNINNEKLIKNLEIIYRDSKKLILETFKDENYLSICKIILAKSSFLKTKILLRKSEEIISENGKLYIQSRNEYTEFSTEKIINSPSVFAFRNWISYIINHYCLNQKADVLVEEQVDAFKDKDNKDLTFRDIHIRIRYYKDILSVENVDSAYSKLKEIKKELVNKLKKSEKDSFEEYCLITNTTYCYNNILSLLNENNNETELLKIYHELKNIDTLKSRKNYFATGTVLSHYAKKLDEIFRKEDIGPEISNCTEILYKCEDLIYTYTNEQKWFKNHNNYLFLLPVNESTVKIDDIDLYIFSGTALPTSSKYLDKKFEKSVESIRFHQTSFKSITSIKSSLDTVKRLNTNIEELEKKLAEKDTRTLELVALIGALLSFIAGSIPGFQFINTGLEALWFTIALGTSLSFFVFLLFFANRDIEFLRKRWYILIIYIIFVGTAWFLLFKSSNKYTEQKFDKSQIIKYIDSLDVKKEALDSANIINKLNPANNLIVNYRLTNKDSNKTNLNKKK